MAGCPIRGNLPPAELVEHQLAIEDFAYEAGAPLYHTGEAGHAVFLVKSGAVKLVRFDPSGGQRIVRILRSGDMVGLEAVLESAYRHAAFALAGADVCRIPVSLLQRLGSAHPELHLWMLEKSQQALQEADAWLVDLVNNTTPGRVRLARLLLRLREGGGDAVYRLSLADAGAIIGLTPETVSRALAEFFGEGLLTKTGRGMGGRRFRADIAALERIARGE